MWVIVFIVGAFQKFLQISSDYSLKLLFQTYIPKDFSAVLCFNFPSVLPPPLFFLCCPISKTCAIFVCDPLSTPASLHS